MSQVKKKRKKKTKVGAIVYWSFLAVWAVLLAVGVYFGLGIVKEFGGYWEAADVNPKIDSYMDRLSVEIWEDGDNSVRSTISSMEHPYQTDEECVEALKEILSGELRCLPGSGQNKEGEKTFNLLSGQSKFGQLYAKQKPFEPDLFPVLNWAIEKFSLYPWEVEGVEFFLDGLYTTFDITVPASYTVMLNGHPLTEAEIVERDIPYNVLQDYYDEFDGLPTKVTYHAEKLFGHVDYELLDEKGEPTTIDPEQDDSQFIVPISQPLMDRFADFTPQFARRYLEFCAGTGDMWYQYNLLQHYLVKNSDLADRLYRMIDSYIGWQHNSNFNFIGANLNGAISLGNNMYVLDMSADARFLMPNGTHTEHRDMKVYVKHDPASNELFAFSEEDYNNDAVQVG